MAAERRFPVMGTTGHVLVVPGPRIDASALLDTAESRLDELERRWSRFRPTSEVCRLNDAAGASLPVSSDTQLLLARAVEGWEGTAGRFDPTVLPALVAAGYDDTFDVVAARHPWRDVARTAFGAAPGCAGFEIDRRSGTVKLPPGVRFDPGAIGKGLAADLVARELMELGARGVCVNLGGDLRVVGEAPESAGWVVELTHPLGEAGTSESLGAVHLSSGAVASTWRTRRAWGPEGHRRHHVIDPDVGAPAATGLAGVVVVTGRAWWAEVLATAAFLSGEDAVALLEAHGVSGLSVADDGTVRATGAIEVLQRCWA